MLKSYKDFKFDNATITNKITDHVVQRLPSNILTIKGQSYQLRLFAVIASVEPLVAFICQDGIASVDIKYASVDDRLIDDDFECMDKQAGKEKASVGAQKMRLEEYWKIIGGQGLNVEEVWAV